MANPNDSFQYLPLNTMDYDLSMQSSMGDANFDNNIEMYMDPQFWTTGGLGNTNVDESTQAFPPLDLGDLRQSPEQDLDASIRSLNAPPIQSLTSPTSSLASPVSTRASTKHDLKRESISKKSAGADDELEDDKDLSVSAEEDKRRRNTAASARFRVKKKQREQAMEKTAKEMTDKCTQLEGRVKELEKENKLLKGLLTEKAIRGSKVQSESSSSDEDASLLRSLKRAKPNDGAR